MNTTNTSVETRTLDEPLSRGDKKDPTKQEIVPIGLTSYPSGQPQRLFVPVLRNCTIYSITGEDDTRSRAQVRLASKSFAYFLLIASHRSGWKNLARVLGQGYWSVSVRVARSLRYAAVRNWPVCEKSQGDERRE